MGRNSQLQIPAPGIGDVELADVGEFGIERRDDVVCLVVRQIEGAGVGEDDAFLVEAQVHRVGTQPVPAARLVAAFAEQLSAVGPWFYEHAYANEIYDLELDSSAMTPEEVCDRIAARLREGPGGGARSPPL